MFIFDSENVFIHFVCSESPEWPEDEEWTGFDDAKDLIQHLLTHDPLYRLGTAGAQEVKEHPFFTGLNWESLLRQKAEFVPQLDDEEDTSYFDSEFMFFLGFPFYFYM